MCEGGIVTFVKDNEPINNDFLILIEEELKERGYKIAPSQIFIKPKEITEKTVAFMDYVESINFRDFVGNKNLITIMKRHYFSTTNTQLAQLDIGDIPKGQINYAASLIILLKGGRMKVLKSKYAPFFDQDNLEIIKDITDLNTLIRKMKIKTLNKI